MALFVDRQATIQANKNLFRMPHELEKSRYKLGAERLNAGIFFGAKASDKRFSEGNRT